MGSVSGLKANAAKFVSTNQQTLSISDNASISAGNIDLTLAAHVYLNNATTTYYIIDKSNNGSSMEYRLSYTSGKLRFRFGTGLLDSPSVSANAWHTVVAWYDSGNDTINLQVDNGTVTSASYANGAPDTTYPLLFGDSLTSAAPFDGRVDEVAIYKRVLTVQERSWLHNGGVGRTYAELDSTSSLVDYTYDLNHVHAVKTVGTSDSYTYDANGNMTCRVEAGVTYKQDYNVENQLITVSKMDGDCVTGTILETTSFTYDGDGNLVKTTKPDNSKTIYVGGVYEEDKTGTTVTHTRTYYPAGGAMRIDGTLYYVLKDHLGSASVITDESGNPLTNGEQRYYPFGESRITGANMLTDKLYTGQRDTGLGIYYYNARFYSPYINHFVSADTIVPGYTNPQSLNRYSYVANNPVRYTDPTGHMRVADGPVQDRFRKSVYHRYRSPRPQRGERERKDDSGSQQEDTDWLHNLAGNKYTPLGLAIVQDAASEVQSFGQGLEAAGFVTANPAAAATGGAIFDGGFWVGRIAGVLGTGDTIYQYYKNLNGTNGTDVYESITTTVIGIYPPLSTKAARFNTAYTFIRLSVDVPEIPFILPRK